MNAKFKPPGPASKSPESSSSSRARRGPDGHLIAALEQRLRTLKQAAKCEEDAHIAKLIGRWRAAGREVTERLFRMIPEPEPEFIKPARASGWGWSWDETPFRSEITDEHHTYLRNECEVKNGEIFDSDGVPLFKDDITLDDVLTKQATRVRTSSPQRPRYLGRDYEHRYAVS